MTPYTIKVIEIIRNIPRGRVMTYGQIAELAGNRMGARQVVRILHSMSEAKRLPWHRVVNVSGTVVISGYEDRFQQMFLLKEEGISVNEKGKIDLKQYQYWP